MDYATRDGIADAYIPILILIFGVGMVGRARKAPGDRVFLKKLLVFLAGLMALSYGLLFLDRAISFGDALSFDYSTHTAVALSLVLALSLLFLPFRLMFAGSFLLYALLMLYQKYHTVWDVILTSVPVVLVAGLLARRLFARGSQPW
ncbi:MAG: hypothetical protein IAE94_16460 [Chthoniobacterales bacterium]|nr:hypothetical protein [Chthoniobacterales bacterium]